MSRQPYPFVVTLFGQLMPECSTPGGFTLDVEPRMGDAPKYGLGGQITFLHRQCYEVTPPATSEGYALIRIPEHIANLKSELAGNFRKKRKGR
jgi:hypothetical protein